MTLKGYAFVDFISHEVAAKAIESMQDKRIKVKLAIQLPSFFVGV